MKKQQLKNLSLSKKTVSNLNKSGIKGGNSTYSLDLGCTSGNVVSAILICYEGYTEQLCNC